MCTVGCSVVKCVVYDMRCVGVSCLYTSEVASEFPLSFRPMPIGSCDGYAGVYASAESVHTKAVCRQLCY